MAAIPVCYGNFIIFASAYHHACPIQLGQVRFSQKLKASASQILRPCFSVAAPEKAVLDDETEKDKEVEEMSTLTPNAFEVQSLLMEVCDETSIAELKLKVGAFSLHMKRDVGKLKGSGPPVPIAPPVPTKPMVDSDPAVTSAPASTALAPKATTSSIAALLSAPVSKPGSRFGLLEAAADEGLAFATSPKVGLFRRSRVVKGKSGRALCEEGQVIKEGQVVCYVEQLGTQQPVEAETSGEVVKILWKDGEPVGYGDPLIAIRPSFPVLFLTVMILNKVFQVDTLFRSLEDQCMVCIAGREVLTNFEIDVCTW